MNRSRITFVALVIATIAAIIFAFTGCGSSEKSTPNKAESAIGTYKNDNFEATIASDKIEVYLTSDGSKSLYWAGTWSEGQSVTSQADKEALNSSITGSQSDEKKFNVGDGTVSFEFSAMGNTTDVTLKKEN